MLLREAIELLNQLANINGISALCQVSLKLIFVPHKKKTIILYCLTFSSTGNDIRSKGSKPNSGRDRKIGRGWHGSFEEQVTSPNTQKILFCTCFQNRNYCFAHLLSGSSAPRWRPLTKPWAMLLAVLDLRWPGVTVWLTWEGTVACRWP